MLYILQQDVASKIAYDLLNETINSSENDKKMPQYLSLIRK